MFARLTATVLATLPILAFGQQTCQTGNLSCCNSLTSAQSPLAADLLGGLLPVLGEVTGLIGLDCIPVGVAGGGGVECNEQTVCCENNNFQGTLISLGCTPININA